MNILIIGGSRFIGKEVARQSIKAGHQVTLFKNPISVAATNYHQVFF